MSGISQQIIDQTQEYGAKNYHPLPIVVTKAEGSGWKILKETVIWIC
ncbi:hypothetical protein MUN89_16335 [Halobacillus salinarum]|uniref:Uncharacterized protein n=1 Tax=Halobacillus salinarum TaxID=2932257 RepID=A0ABY4EH62_9BACI|nr:hypothetical protein MUN89_16335 [Halobacillus salinarum]